MAWFEASTPALSQLGATIGRGLSSTAPATPVPQQVDYSELFENQIAEQKREADRTYKLNKAKLDQDYKIAKQNARTAQERNQIDRWYNEQQVQIAQQRLAEEGRQFDQRLSFDREVQAQNLGLNQARLGYDVLGMQAQLRGPEDYFAASNYARGVAAQPGTATFLNALRDNSHLAAFGAQAGAPDAVSVNSLSAKLGGPNIIPGTGAATPTSTSGVDDLHRQIQQIGLAGAHKLGAGALERLTDTELKLLQGGLGTAGPDGKAFDVPTFMQQYARSRIGQSLGNVRAA